MRVRKTTTKIGYVAVLMLACFGTTQVEAQGKSPFYIDDTVVFGTREFQATFSLFEREDVRAAPGTGEPQKEWIEESSVAIYAVNAPDLGANDRALALKLARAFCEHYGLKVNAKPDSSAFSGSEWTFVNLCWKTGW